MPGLLLSNFASCGACSILHTLRVRYTLDMIYTYSGNILIAVCFMPESFNAVPTLLDAFI